MTLNPKNSSGQIRKTIRVYSSDQKNPLIKLSVLAEIKRHGDNKKSKEEM